MIKYIKIGHNYCLTHRWPFETLLKQMHMWKRIKRTHLYVRTRCDLFVPGPIARASLYQPFKRPISIKQAAQWFRAAKNWDISTGPIARPFARSFPLTPLLAPRFSLRLPAPLRSCVRSLDHSPSCSRESE